MRRTLLEEALLSARALLRPDGLELGAKLVDLRGGRRALRLERRRQLRELALGRRQLVAPLLRGGGGGRGGRRLRRLQLLPSPRLVVVAGDLHGGTLGSERLLRGRALSIELGAFRGRVALLGFKCRLRVGSSLLRLRNPLLQLGALGVPLRFRRTAAARDLLRRTLPTLRGLQL